MGTLCSSATKGRGRGGEGERKEGDKWRRLKKKEREERESDFGKESFQWSSASARGHSETSRRQKLFLLQRGIFDQDGSSSLLSK